jgi:hypothetical protein
LQMRRRILSAPRLVLQGRGCALLQRRAVEEGRVACGGRCCKTREGSFIRWSPVLPRHDASAAIGGRWCYHQRAGQLQTVRGGRRWCYHRPEAVLQIKGRGSCNRRCVELQWCAAGAAKVCRRCCKALLPELQARRGAPSWCCKLAVECCRSASSSPTSMPPPCCKSTGMRHR